jgi:SNF2 family DNA or RNA helicase
MILINPIVNPYKIINKNKKAKLIKKIKPKTEVTKYCKWSA